MAAVVALTVLVAAALIIVMAVLWVRHRNQELAHQERLAALEKGVPMPPGPAPAPWSPRVYLLRGLIWTFVGAALTVALLGAALSDHRGYYEAPEWQARRAREIANQLEIPIDQARTIVTKDAERRSEQGGTPPAIALFGLIPLAVGVAYLVYYRSEPVQQAIRG